MQISSLLCLHSVKQISRAPSQMAKGASDSLPLCMPTLTLSVRTRYISHITAYSAGTAKLVARPNLCLDTSFRLHNGRQVDRADK